jgi:hypothetical protein
MFLTLTLEMGLGSLVQAHLGSRTVCTRAADEPRAERVLGFASCRPSEFPVRCDGEVLGFGPRLPAVYLGSTSARVVYPLPWNGRATIKEQLMDVEACTGGGLGVGR